MTNYRLVVAAVSIPTITAIFGLLWFWDRKKKKELARNDGSSISKTLNKNTNSFTGSCSSLYEALSEPLNNGTNNIAVISGNDEDDVYDDEDEHTEQRPLLGQDWIQKINSSFLSNDSEDSNNSESNNGVVSKNDVADQDSETFTYAGLEASGKLIASLSSINCLTPKTEFSEAQLNKILFGDSNNSESNIDTVNNDCVDVADKNSEVVPNVGSEVNEKLIASLSSVNCQTPKTELSELQMESEILSCPEKLEGKPCMEDFLFEGKDKEDGKIDDGEAVIVKNEGKEEKEKDLIPEVKNELSTSADLSPLTDSFEEQLAKTNSAESLESLNKALRSEEVQPSLETHENVSKEFTSEEESDDQPESPGTKSNGFGNEEANPLLSALDKNGEVETDRQVVDLIPEVKNGNSEELLVCEEVSDLEKTIPAIDSFNGNYEDNEQSEISTSELRNGTYSEFITSDEYVSSSEKTNQLVGGCDQKDNDSKDSSLDDIKLQSKSIDVISAIFSGGQLNDSQLKADLAHLQAQATKMSTPNHATSEKLLSHAKQLFHESGSITPPETDSDTYLSSKEIMSETMESDQTDDLSLTPNPSNQSEDEENESSSPLSSSPQREREDELDSLSNKSFGNGQIPTDKKTSSVSLGGQHVEDIIESEAPNSEPFQKKTSSPILDKSSSNSDLPIKTDNLENQHNLERNSESKSLISPVVNIAEHSTEDTIVAEKLEKELEKINKDVSQDLESEILNGNSSLEILTASQQPNEEATKTLGETLSNAHDSTHQNQNNNALSVEKESHQLESNAVIQAKSGPENRSPPKEQGKPDSVLSSNCDAKNTKLPDINKMAVKTKSSTLYEFYFPSELCGRLIGRQGKNIIHIKERSGASVSLQPSPYTPNHQICSIEGTQEEIDEALKCISQKFPNSIYPNVDLTAITDSTQLATSPVVVPDLIQVTSNLILSLPPDGVSIDILVASIVDGGHLFLQLPTHPTYAALERLNQFMNRCYSQPGMVPQLPRPLTVGVICAAPVMEGWYRAVIVAVCEETDECEIKFVDYGGFSRVPGNLLRQIRSDFMTLPFQAIEAYLANITPLQNENYFSDRAVEILQELTENGMLQAQVVSRAEDGTPYVHIYQINGNKVTFVNRELVNRGAVRWIEVL